MTTLFSNPDPSTPVAPHTSPVPSTDPFHQADLGDDPDARYEDEDEHGDVKADLTAPPAPPAQTRSRRTSRPAARR
ncbi:hypothetical protein [Streptomyces sp. SPB162]|uniref:hypothetical protein n=1 Tax=Streptomyces sp. SPB162 TaxID=2940560 RepID=UPI0024075750|nr:hypothetical protein [Streptomyces sp. SPB162]MDF9816890.1 hypothetical protein [Streptomyces sp. SPB162]